MSSIFLAYSLSGLFRQTFSGCRTLVNLLGITAMSVLVWGSACFGGSVRWARNDSHTSKLFFFVLGDRQVANFKLFVSKALCRLHPSNPCADDWRIPYLPLYNAHFLPAEKVRKLRCALHTKSFVLDSPPSLACKHYTSTGTQNLSIHNHVLLISKLKPEPMKK